MTTLCFNVALIIFANQAQGAHVLVPDRILHTKEAAHQPEFRIEDAENIATHYTCHREDTPPNEDADYSECRRVVREGLKSTHPDQYKRTPSILETYGYTYIEYKVTTEDGYILTVYRITDSPKRKTRNPHFTPVYVNHGLMGASDWWFFLPPHKAVPLRLADEGYDVWLPNARGTSYSLEHETLDHDDINFWDFSFHEMGVYDVPAITNTIVCETNRTDMIYVGYSMGCNEYFVTMSELPSLNARFRSAFLLGCAPHIGHTSSPFRGFCPLVDTEERYNVSAGLTKGRLRNNYEIRKLFGLSSTELCTTNAAKCGLCDNVWFAMWGFNPPQLNRTMLPLIMEKNPNYASIRTLAHFAQLIETCEFRKFNYFERKNIELYGTKEPPLYDLKKVKGPLYLYYGDGDHFIRPTDRAQTLKLIKKSAVKKLFIIKDKHFNHMDFSIASNADKLLYNEMLRDMEKYRDDH